MRRAPEQPRYTLMITPNGDIAAVVQEYEKEKRTCGWVTVARESEILPFNTPRLMAADEGEVA